MTGKISRIARPFLTPALATAIAASLNGFTSLATTTAAEPTPPASQRPNILFIFTDDHASHAISAYGSKINKTPHLDRLANEGMLFRNCFCTNSICAPSRAVIQTGKHSHINGVIDNRVPFDPKQQTFPKLLQKAGYQTAIVGKWHLKTDPTGFDYWEVLPGQGHYYNPDFKTPGGTVHYTGYVTDIITDLALDWLKNKRDPGKPFMVMYQHKAPHRSWLPGPDHLTLYDDVTIPEPDTLFDDYEGRSTAAKKQAMTIAHHMNLACDLKVPPETEAAREKTSCWKQSIGRLNDEQAKAWNAAYEPKNEAFRKAKLKGKDLVRWNYQRYIKDYLRCIASVDDNVGRVLKYLDESGLADNTVVIYTSDQGSRSGCPSSCAGPPWSNPPRSTRISCRTSISPRRSSTSPASRSRPTCRADRSCPY
jgi:arylsulfatase A-like enzyme